MTSSRNSGKSSHSYNSGANDSDNSSSNSMVQKQPSFFSNISTSIKRVIPSFKSNSLKNSPATSNKESPSGTPLHSSRK